MTRFAKASIAVACIALAILACFKIAIPTAAPGDAQMRGGAARGAGVGYLVLTGASGSTVALGRGASGDHLLIHASLLGLADGGNGRIGMFNLLGGVFAFGKPRLEAYLPRAVDGDLNLFADGQGRAYRVFYFTGTASSSIFQANAPNAGMHFYLNAYFDDGPIIEYRWYVDDGHLAIRILGGGPEKTIENPGQSKRALLESIEVNDFHDGDYGIHLSPVYLPYGSYPKGFMLFHDEDAEAHFDPVVAGAFDAAVHAIADGAQAFSLTADSV